ncbi:DUF3231 family protein [Bacillus sp. EB600]|nr:DUF3231 family protein [Bacillus sp. EB600]
MYFRLSVIVPPDRPDFVQHEHFLEGWFGDQRPLSTIEIADIYFNLKKSIFAKAVTLAFSQIAPSENVRKFLIEAVQVKNKYITEFHEV